MKIIIELGGYHLDAPLNEEGLEYAVKWLGDIGKFVLNMEGKTDKLPKEDSP